jgi:histidyl-tRNA synthetase
MLNTDPYKGVRDFYPEEKALQNYIFSVWKRTLESYGYAEYDASILEPTEIYQAKSGEELINEQTYTFLDRGDRSVTLRPEMTPTVARMVAKRWRELPTPLRLYSIPNLFRYERPQRGRLREHWQLNADIFGVESAEADIELINIASDMMKNFGLKDDQFEIRLSSRKLLNAIFSEWYELKEDEAKKLKKLIDKKSKMPTEDFQEKAEEIVGKAFKFLSLNEDEELYEEAMALPMIRSAKEELDDVIEKLKEIGIKNVIYDPELIRGFDYYTGIIFEIYDKHPDNNRSLFGGGRYDGLTSLFVDENIPASGFGMGDVTILDVLETYHLIPEEIKKSKIKVYVCSIEDADLDESKRMAAFLRQNGVNCAVHLNQKKLSDQIRQAEKQRVAFALIIGSEETASKTYTLKNLESGESLKVSPEELLNNLK